MKEVTILFLVLPFFTVNLSAVPPPNPPPIPHDERLEAVLNDFKNNNINEKEIRGILGEMLKGIPNEKQYIIEEIGKSRKHDYKILEKIETKVKLEKLETKLNVLLRLDEEGLRRYALDTINKQTKSTDQNLFDLEKKLDRLTKRYEKQLKNDGANSLRTRSSFRVNPADKVLELNSMKKELDTLMKHYGASSSNTDKIQTSFDLDNKLNRLIKKYEKQLKNDENGDAGSSENASPANKIKNLQEMKRELNALKKFYDTKSSVERVAPVQNLFDLGKTLDRLIKKYEKKFINDENRRESFSSASSSQRASPADKVQELYSMKNELNTLIRFYESDRASSSSANY